MEGEYLKDNKWNGKIKEYDYDNLNLKNEGEYLNGIKHANGRNMIIMVN